MLVHGVTFLLILTEHLLRRVFVAVITNVYYTCYTCARCKNNALNY